MTALALVQPQKTRVNRSDLRDQQSKYLKKACGTHIIEIVGRDEEEGKYVVDKDYLDQVLAKLKSAIETMNVIKDQKLFNQLMKASQSMDDDIRLGRLHSFEEAFGEE